MVLNIFALVIGILLLWQGSEFLIRGATGIARNLDVTPFVIGITIVALGTTMPEFMVSLVASFQGNGDIVLGTIIGSYIVNIGLILGVTGLIASFSINKLIVNKEFPFFLAAPIVLFILAFDGFLSRIDGVILVTIAFVFYTLLIKHIREGKLRRTLEDIAEAALYRHKVYASYIFTLILGLIGIVVGAKLTVGGSIGIARLIGVPELIVALFLIAIGTSLPELGTAIVAAFKKEQAISVGNIFGSNILVVFVILGIALVIAPLQVHKSLIIFDIPMMILFSLLLFFVLLKYGRLRRQDAVAFLALYVLYIGYNFLK